MERSSVFGGTFALASTYEWVRAEFEYHDQGKDYEQRCPYCKAVTKDRFAAWVTDQCIKQGLSHERQADPLI